MSSPTLTIITINLNNIKGLQKTIDSVLSQSFKDYEWIIIDGGSTDGSKELIEQHKNHFAYWCSEPDNGIYNAMNKGVAHAHGEWLQFLNSGDWLFDSKTLDRVFAITHSEEILYGDFIEYNNGKYGRYYLPNKISLHYLQYRDINHQAMFINIKKVCKIEYDESIKIVADWHLFVSLALQGYSFRHLDYPIVYYEGMGISNIYRNEAATERASVWRKTIPPLILEDMYELTIYEQHNIYINTHRILKTLKKICQMVEKMIRKIELKRQKS